MKETIVVVIMAIAIYKCCEVIFEMIFDINKSKKWAKLKTEVFQFIKECTDSDDYILENQLVGIKDECTIFYVNFSLNEERKIKMLKFSTLAYSYGRKVEWKMIDNKLFVKISLG